MYLLENLPEAPLPLGPGTGVEKETIRLPFPVEQLRSHLPLLRWPGIFTPDGYRMLNRSQRKCRGAVHRDFQIQII
jgi:hypothetical protein